MTAERLRLLVLGQLDHIHVAHMARAMAERDFDVVVAGNVVGGYGEPLRDEPSLHAIELPRFSNRNPLDVISQIRWIRKLIRQHRPHVTHAHWLCGNAALAATAGAKPLVSMAWGSDILRASRVHRLANRWALYRSDLALGVSPELCEAMVALGAPRERVAQVSWGVDLEHFSPPLDRAALRSRLGLPNGRLILSPRTMLPLYNPRVIVEAFERIADRVPDAHLALLSLYKSEYDLGPLLVPNRVHIVGTVSYEQMPDYLGAADVSVSIPSSDGSPRTVWEAMACGSPTVLSDLPWLKGMIAPGREAIVVPIEVDRVAAALLDLLTDDAAAKQIATNARALVVRSMSRDVQMDRLASLLRGASRASVAGRTSV